MMEFNISKSFSLFVFCFFWSACKSIIEPGIRILPPEALIVVPIESLLATLRVNILPCCDMSIFVLPPPPFGSSASPGEDSVVPIIILETVLSALYVKTINIAVTVRATIRAWNVLTGFSLRVLYAKLSINLTQRDTKVQAMMIANRASTKVNSDTDLDDEDCAPILLRDFNCRIKILYVYV